jgi:hypothetical protein
MVHAQRKKKAVQPPVTITDTTRSPALHTPETGPKLYQEIITAAAVTQRGLFIVHFLKEHYYFEIPDSLLGRDILVVNRIDKSATGKRASMLGYAGDEIGNNVIRFEKGVSDKLFLKSVSFGERSEDSTQTGMYRSVLNSNLQPIVAAFDIKTYGTGSSVIDITDFINSDTEILFFQSWIKKVLTIGNQLNDRSFISGIKVFPANMEIRTIKTYQKTDLQASPSSVPATFELNSSMILLPAVPMQARCADPRVGYFAVGYVDFDANPQGVKNEAVITRWRLEPRKEDMEKYRHGELVEPARPIIYYIDPATPKKWVPYLIQGVNDWQVAFEQAGFKNAIKAMEAPADSTWSLDDARHNVIVYKPADVSNASGPHIHDPRSGEILETHVNWYHNVMKLLHDWYMIQAGAIDPKARKMQFDDSLMGQLIRFVSSHEIGHTLGLTHNFGASSTVPVEKLRDKAFVEVYGHTPSIMDYARFNYVAQPEDHITERGIFPRIGDYDKWAIEWGYKWMPEFHSAKEELPALNRLIIDSVGKNKRLWFGTERDYYDPRSQNEDLGDDPMKANAYGIRNLQRILPQLLEWTKEPEEGYDNARDLYQQLINQYNTYMGHVAKEIGGRYSTPKTAEEKGNVYEPVPYEKQKEAMAFLDKYLFTSPLWLVNQPLINQTGVDMIASIKRVQDNVLRRIVGPDIVYRLVCAGAIQSSVRNYTATDLFDDLRTGIFKELSTHASMDIYRRNLQKRYIEYLAGLLGTSNIIQITELGGVLFGMIVPAPSQTDVKSLAKAEMERLRSDMRHAIPFAHGMDVYHFKDMIDRITEAFNPNPAHAGTQ